MNKISHKIKEKKDEQNLSIRKKPFRTATVPLACPVGFWLLWVALGDFELLLPVRAALGESFQLLRYQHRWAELFPPQVHQ